MEPEVFFSRLAGALLHTHAQERSDYGNRWREAYRAGEQRIRKISQAAQWCDLQAMDCLFSSLPREWNIQLSNGTPVRYAQLFSSRSFHRCDCNRGVSGIDGCLSTSIGASWAYPGITCLVTGDMSCQYDISALGSPLLTKRWKMIVLSNGGGGIFRFVSSTRSLPEREAFFGSGPMNLPLANLARAYGMAYTEACNLQEARQGLQWLAHEENSPAILCLVTPADYSAKMLSAAITPGPVH